MQDKIRGIVVIFAVAVGFIRSEPVLAADPGANYSVTCRSAVVPPRNQVRESCRIVYPNVKQPWTSYPEIPLRQGDIVLLTANGCVQTGGHGKSWKDYTAPQGKKADYLYFGQFRVLKSADADIVAPTRFLPRQGASEFVLPIGVPAQLAVGYVDDDYLDNGYWGHDNGNFDQCKAQDRAVVDIIITHSGLPAIPFPPPVPPPPAKGALIILYSFGDIPGTERSTVRMHYVGTRNGGSATSDGDHFLIDKGEMLDPVGPDPVVNATAANLNPGAWVVTAVPSAIGAPVQCSAVVVGGATRYLNIHPEGQTLAARCR